MTGKQLKVPALPDDADAYTAALAYAQAGLYVLPIRQGTKHPGSLLEKDWPSKSTRSAADIHCLWREDWPRAGVGLHAGRSGVIVIDVDKPDALPDVLRKAIMDRRPPFQVTRELPAGMDVQVALDACLLRGHALFAVPEGRMFGNSLGQLPKGWGDIRGANGFIVTAPTRHAEPDGRYRWLRTGRIPVLPEAVATLLPDGGDNESVATDEQVKAFRDRHTIGTGKRAMTLIDNAVKQFVDQVRRGGGRHTEAVEVAVWMAREAAAGMYPAGVAFNELWREFERAVSADRGARNASASLRAEFDGIVAWAVGQALAAGPGRIDEVREKLNPGINSIDGATYAQASLLDDPEPVAPPEPVEPVAELVEPAELEPPEVPGWMADADPPSDPHSEPQEGHGSPARATVRGEQPDTDHPDDHAVVTESLDFWGRRKALAHIWQYAVARYASPWAVLGVVLARVVAATPPAVRLDTGIGTPASLNLFVALVASPGGGKGAAESVGAEAVEIDRRDSGLTTDFAQHALGSGEGLAHMFMRRPRPTKADPDPDMYQYNVAALVTIPEIDTFRALQGRQGSTLTSQLRQAAMGERLGFFYVDRDKRVNVPPHQYRLCLIAGVQPRRAQVLLDDTDGGTPQRFLWLPAVHPDAPDEVPDCPDPLLWVAPEWPTAMGGGAEATGLVPVELPQVALDRTLQLRRDGNRGLATGFDGHANLTRLKVASALAILDGRTAVDDEDWELSGLVMDKSDATRDGMVAESKMQAREKTVAEGLAEAEKHAVVSDQLDVKSRRKLTRLVLEKLADAESDGWIAAGPLRAKITPRLRDYFEEVMDGLTTAGQVICEAVEYRGQSGYRYKLTSRADGPVEP